MSSVATVSKPANANAKAAVERARGWVNPLNLHFLGVGLLLLVNVYLLVQILFVWRKASNNDAEAMSQQRVALKTAQIAAQPLRGLDAKLATTTEEADAFYRERLPETDSDVLAELGALTKAHGVRLTRAQYALAPVMPGTPGELTERRIDASLSGDYRPLAEFINALERDKMFFVITGVSLSGQQSGTVNLRLRLTTYLRGAGMRGVAISPGDLATGGSTR